ncbi:RbsD/FucU family protein [Lichenicoccus sp.]|uniref:RbsD/FucU family protein n=1 Tax=Lichenicoccus sp. TaxID=2781899 RepID=UPI003D09F62E
MLRGIDPLLTPGLLHTMASMGHGDRIAIVDANFPGASNAQRLHELPGLDAGSVLRAVLSLLPLDDFVPDPAVTMQVVGDAGTIPEAVQDFTVILGAHDAPAPTTVERFAFYELAKSAYAIVQTGETRLYGNIIIAKGVIKPF